MANQTQIEAGSNWQFGEMLSNETDWYKGSDIAGTLPPGNYRLRSMSDQGEARPLPVRMRVGEGEIVVSGKDLLGLKSSGDFEQLPADPRSDRGSSWRLRGPGKLQYLDDGHPSFWRVISIEE